MAIKRKIIGPHPFFETGLTMKKDYDTGLGLKARELRSLPEQTLRAMVETCKERLLTMRSAASTAGDGRKSFSEKPHYFKLFKKTIARIKTVLGER